MPASARCPSSEAKLLENARAFVDAIQRAKPTGAKGTYVKKVAVSSSMGPGVKVDVASLALRRPLPAPTEEFACPPRAGGQGSRRSGDAGPNLSETARGPPVRRGLEAAYAPPAIDGEPREFAPPGGLRLRGARMAWRSGSDRRTGVRRGGAGSARAAARTLVQPAGAPPQGPANDGDGIWTARKSASSSQALAAVFAETSFVLVGQNKGLTVAEVSDLRRRMRAAGATYKVAKNRLATLALDGTRFQGIAPLLKGPTALAWSTDPVAVAKTAVEFAKEERQVRDPGRGARRPRR